MDGRARVRLGQHEQPCAIASASASASASSCVDGARRRRRAGCRGRSRRPRASGLASPSSTSVVLAVAEEREVVVGQPAQERARPRRARRVDRRRVAARARRPAPAQRSRIGCQSSTAARTSSSTRSMPSSQRARAARVGLAHRPRRGAPTRAIASGRSASPGSSTSTSEPSASRRTRITGWITRSIAVPLALASSIVTESTMNGMSSLTISIDGVRRLPAVLLEVGVVDADLRSPGVGAGRGASARAPRRTGRAGCARRDPRRAPSGSTGARTSRTRRLLARQPLADPRADGVDQLRLEFHRSQSHADPRVSPCLIPAYCVSRLAC